MKQVITRWNRNFGPEGCPEYLDKTGGHFTLHLDKAQIFKNHDEAVYWARELGYFPSCSITDAPRETQNV